MHPLARASQCGPLGTRGLLSSAGGLPPPPASAPQSQNNESLHQCSTQWTWLVASLRYANLRVRLLLKGFYSGGGGEEGGINNPWEAEYLESPTDFFPPADVCLWVWGKGR